MNEGYWWFLVGLMSGSQSHWMRLSYPTATLISCTSKKRCVQFPGNSFQLQKFEIEMSHFFSVLFSHMFPIFLEIFYDFPIFFRWKSGHSWPAEVKALLPPEGKSHALRRRDGKRLPLHGTAPAAPEDMPQPAGQAQVMVGLQKSWVTIGDYY